MYGKKEVIVNSRRKFPSAIESVMSAASVPYRVWFRREGRVVRLFVSPINDVYLDRRLLWEVIGEDENFCGSDLVERLEERVYLS